MTRRAPLRLLALCCALPLCAAPHDPWLRIASANFELFTTAGERSGRDLRHFEQVRRPHRRAMVEALKDGGAAAAFQKAYGKSIDQVQDDLRVYPTNATIHAAVFDIQLPKQVDSLEIESAAGLPARMALAELPTDTRGKLETTRTRSPVLLRIEVLVHV